MTEVKDYAIIAILVLILVAFITGFRIEWPFQFNGNETTTTTTTLIDCGDYDLYEEFRDEFGRDVIRDSENYCENPLPTGLDGTYYDEADIIGCLWNPALPDIDCNSDEIEAAEEFCEDELLADWVCDNSISFVGCICRREEPNWSPPGDIPEEDYCQMRGDNFLAIFQNGEFCGGDCEDESDDCIMAFFEDEPFCFCGVMPV